MIVSLINIPRLSVVTHRQQFMNLGFVRPKYRTICQHCCKDSTLFNWPSYFKSPSDATTHDLTCVPQTCVVTTSRPQQLMLSSFPHYAINKNRRDSSDFWRQLLASLRADAIKVVVMAHLRTRFFFKISCFHTTSKLIMLYKLPPYRYNIQGLRWSTPSFLNFK